MNFLEHFQALEAERKGETVYSIGALSIAPRIMHTAAVNALFLERQAQQYGLEVAVKVPEESTRTETPTQITPVVVMDTSGSMITPENKALVALVANQLMADTNDSLMLFGNHTSSVPHGSDIDAFMADRRIGGTILSATLRKLAEDRTFNQEHEAGVLYYLTDGDNWMDDTECFCDYLEALYVSGRITQAVIHISSNRLIEHSNFKPQVQHLADTYEGINVVVTGNCFEDSRENAAKALAAFIRK